MNILSIAAALAATAFSTPAAAAPITAQPMATVPADVRMEHISIVAMGSGPPLMLIPGLASPRAVWDGVAPGLARTHRVYLVQVNGFGGDDPGANLKPAILDGIVDDLSGFLRREQSAPVRLVGHSLGGLAGLMFARAHPDQVERLMIVDSLPYFPALMAPGGEPPTVAAVEPIARAMRDRVAARHGQPADAKAIEADIARLALKPDSKATIAEWAAAADPRVTAQLLYEDMTTDLRPSLAEIRTPITLVYPWSSSAFGKDRTLAFYQRQYAGTPTVDFVGIGEAGHFAILDQPAAFAELIGAFAD